MAYSLMNLTGLTAFSFGEQPDIGEAMANKGTKTKISRR